MKQSVDNIIETVGSVGYIVALIALLIVLAFEIVLLIARIKLFKKCGKKAWQAFIPFYTDYVFIKEICGLHWFWFVGYIIATSMMYRYDLAGVLLNLINLMSFYNLSVRTNKDKATACLFGFLAPHFATMVYGFSNLTYDPNIEVKESAIF